MRLEGRADFGMRAADGASRAGGRLITTVAALVLASLLVGSAAAESRGASAKPALRIGIVNDPGADPSKEGGNQFFSSIYTLAYAPLFHTKADGTVVPSLAASWRYFKTGSGVHKGFEFTLRRNARFSDGTPVTAAAVVGWLRYYAAATNNFTGVLGPKPRFEAVSRFVGRVRLTVPTPNLPHILSDAEGNWGYVASPKAVADPSLFANGTQGAGPYMLDSSRSVRGDHYTYIPNPNFYDKASIKFSQVYLKKITTPSSMLQALQSKQVDVVEGDISTASRAKSLGFQVVGPPTTTTVIAFDLEHDSVASKALTDVRVRQAINYAIDRKTITRGLFGAFAEPTSALTTIDTDAKIDSYYPYNVAKAKSLLAAAGYRDGLTIKLLVPSFGGVVNAPVYQAVAKYLDEAGIHTDLTLASLGDYGAELFSWKYHGFSLQFGAGPTPEQYNVFVNPSSFIQLFGVDPIVNSLYYGGLKATNPSVKWGQMWRRIAAQAYFAPILRFSVVYFASKSVDGVATSKARPGAIPTEWVKKPS